MKPQCPENNSIVELALESIDWIAKINLSTINVVRDVPLEQGGKILLQRRDRDCNPFLVFTFSQTIFCRSNQARKKQTEQPLK